MSWLFSQMADPEGLLTGAARKRAEDVITNNHYLHSVPSGKSHYIEFEDALVVWSIPANMNIATFILGVQGKCWELSRLWAPDGHRKNLLTEAIAFAVKAINQLEKPDVLVSYADPNVGHSGGIYKAASWIFHRTAEESRVYVDGSGLAVARRAFHSGDKGMNKQEIEAAGYTQVNKPGKLRFVRPLSLRAKRVCVNG